MSPKINIRNRSDTHNPDHRLTTINHIVYSVTHLKLIKNNQGIGEATGFFFSDMYNDQERLFLVTNRHVIDGSDDIESPDSLSLYLHVSTEINNRHVKIPLYDSNQQRLWKIHPTYDADVALIKLNNSMYDSYMIAPWNEECFPPSGYFVELAEDVFIMGYPLGFFDDINNLPIFRSAMVASVYGVNFNGNRHFLTDANLHVGMSGSPVITKPYFYYQNNRRIFTPTTIDYCLLGIHSSTYNKPGSDNRTLRLGQTWYSDIIKEIAMEFR